MGLRRGTPVSSHSPKDMQVRLIEDSNLSPDVCVKTRLVYGLNGSHHEYSHRCWDGVKKLNKQTNKQNLYLEIQLLLRKINMSNTIS